MNEQTRVLPHRDWAVAFTAQDFEHMMRIGAFNDMRVELVSGELEKMMPALPGHGERNISVAFRLHEAVAGRDLRIGSDIAIGIDQVGIRAADIAVYASGLANDRIPDGQDMLLVVEIADTTLPRDLGEKLSDYARAGVSNYWVVDAKAGVVHVMREPAGTGYGVREIIRFGEPLAVPGSDRTITID